MNKKKNKIKKNFSTSDYFKMFNIIINQLNNLPQHIRQS